MARKRFSVEQIVAVLKQAEMGLPVTELVRQVGITEQTFDLGSDQPPVIVECKSQTWTAGDKVPSAKMKNWAEAMFYFHMAPPVYRKIFFVEQSLRVRIGESLLSYFRRTQSHMIPTDVEFWELPRENDDVVIG